MKFPYKVKVRLDRWTPGQLLDRFGDFLPEANSETHQFQDLTAVAEISIAAVNSAVKNGKIGNSIAVHVIDGLTRTRRHLNWSRIENNSEIKAEICRRIKVKEASTLELGRKILKPCVCLSVRLQVTTKNNLPAEHPDAQPEFRVRLRYWDGSTHTLWSNYAPGCDDLVVRIKKVKTKIVFSNHVAVLDAIKELMPK
jgi:hypothetical protein